MKIPNEVVFDVEGDSLNATKIWVLSHTTPEGTIKSLTSYDEMREFLSSARILVGHNIIRWDIPTLERILGIKIKAKLIDTLTLAWYLFPPKKGEKKKHGLEEYGIRFDIHKKKIDDWESQPVEDYIERCEQDVRINTKLWNLQYTKLRRLYENDKDLWRLLSYLENKMKIAQLQEKNGWEVDLKFVEKSLAELVKERDKRVKELAEVMPRVPILATRKQPKQLYNKKGELTLRGLDWFNLLKKLKKPKTTLEVEVITGYNEPNPGSIPQIKEWLFSLGWVPQTFKTNKGRQVPQVSKEHNQGLCQSILNMIEDHPQLEVLDGLTTIAHRIGILEGFLNSHKDGMVQASVGGLTNTLRWQHVKPLVNLPKPDRPYAASIRKSLIAGRKKKIIGADMSSLEDRLKQHYIYPLDPDYVNTMLRDDFDPHIELAMMGKKLDPEDKILYQKVEKLMSEKEFIIPMDKNEYGRIKKVRSIFKNGNYACQYGAYPPRLALTCNIPLNEAKEVFEAYWKLNWAIKAVTNSLVVKHIDEEMWQYNPVSKFWYSLRKENDKFSTLIQGTASYVFDLWVYLVSREIDSFIGQFHDEFIVRVPEDQAAETRKVIEAAIVKTNEILQLDRELGIGIQEGTSYDEIH